MSEQYRIIANGLISRSTYDVTQEVSIEQYMKAMLTEQRYGMDLIEGIDFNE